MPKFAVTVNDNGVRKRVVLESAAEPTESDVLSALRGSSEQQPAAPATIGEMRRREEQGMVAALPEAQAAVAVGSTAQLNQAVKQSATVGEMRRREEQGLVSALNPEQIKQATMSDAARMGQAMQEEEARLAASGAPSMFDETAPTKEEVSQGVRYGTGPILQTMGIPLPVGQAIGETGYQLMSGETSPRKIAAAAAKEAVTSLGGGAAKILPGPIRRGLFETGQTLLSAAAKVPVQGAMRGLAGEAARTAVSGDEWKFDNFLESARDYAVGETAGSLAGNLIGAGYRKYKGGGDFLGELNRPFYDQFQRNIADKEGELAGKLARAYRADPDQVKNVLAQSFKQNSTKSGQEFADAAVADVEKVFGKLDDDTTVAFSKLANDYDKMESLTLGEAVSAVKNTAQSVYDRKNEAFGKEFDTFRSDPRVQSKDYDKSVARGGEPYGPVSGKSLNDLWKEQQDAAKAIKWGEPVKAGTGDQWAAYNQAKAKFEDALGQFEKRFPKDPLIQNFRDLKDRYSGFMEDYNTTFSKGILKDIGEQGGSWSSIIKTLGGSDGPAKLQQLKKILAEDYDGIKSKIGNTIYNDLNKGGQIKFLDNLENALSKGWNGIQKEVLDEFFPNVTKDGIKQARAAWDVSSKSFAEDFRKASLGKGEGVIASPDVVLEFLNNSKENVTKVKNALSAETLADTQNALLSQIVSEAGKKGPITARSFTQSAESWQNALDGVFGPSGKTKIDEIAKALEIAEKNKTSLVSKLLPGIAGTTAFAKGTTAAGPFFGIAGGERAYRWTEKLQSKIVGYLLDNPNYRAAVIKPFDQLTNAETRMLDNDIPMIIRNLTVRNVMSGE